jgi:uncharacterized iron-regulated membrane protein
MRALVLLHRWVGAALALALFAVAASGALLLFADDYLRWRLPVLAEFPSAPAPDPKALAEVVTRAAEVGGTVAFPKDSLPAYIHYLPGGGQRLHHPIDGRVIAEWGPLDTLPGALFELHAHLLAGEIGHLVLGVIALLLLAMLLSGLVLWWRLRRGLPIGHWRPRSTHSRELLRSHSAQGLWLCLALGFMALSGASLVFHTQAAALFNGFLGAHGPLSPTPRTVCAPIPLATADWRRVLDRAGEHFPDARLRMLTLPRSTDAPVVLRLKRAAELHPNGRSYLTIDAATGAVLQQIDATRTGLGPSVLNSLYPLHAGKTGWFGHRAVLLLLAMALSWISASGLWLFLRRQRREPGRVRTAFKVPSADH